MLLRDASSLRRAAPRDSDSARLDSPVLAARRKRRPSHSRRQRKRHRQALTAAATASPLYFARGRGRELEISAGDLLLIRQAIRKGWSTPLAVREAILAQLVDELPVASGRRVNAIGRLVIDAESRNVDADLADLDSLIAAELAAFEADRAVKTVDTGLAPMTGRPPLTASIDESAIAGPAEEPMTSTVVRHRHRNGGR